MKSLFKTLLLGAFLVFVNTKAYSQRDSTYVVSYSKLLTGRIYLSQKFTSFKYRNTGENYTLVYRPNTNLNLGVGASYKWATLNIAYGFGFLNPDDEKGKTQYLDLQFHGYGDKFALDFLAQFYKGFYLSPRGTSSTGNLPPDRYYIRPDLRINIVGGSYQYIFNHRRFSLRAPFLQTEWQKRSAGSFIAGVESYIGRVRSDSTITPTAINKSAASLNENKNNFFEFGVNAGYAYTLVIQKNFFLTGSASFSLDYGTNTLSKQDGEARNWGFSTNALTRIIGGYNSERWALSMIYINNGVRLQKTSEREMILNTGNVRVSFVHRFVPGPKEKKVLKAIK
jgi:hypothetical protein